MNRSTPAAQATQDHVIRYLSSQKGHHSLDVPAHDVVMEAPLSATQREIAVTLLAGEGVIQPLVRSAIAQLGVDIDAHDVKIGKDSMRIEGKLLAMPNSPGERLLEQMQFLHRHYELIVGRAALLPEHARLSSSEMEEAVRLGQLRAKGGVIDREQLLLPLQRDIHVFDEKHPSEDLMQHVLFGVKSGRALLQEVRSVKMRDDVLPSRSFIVGNIDVHTSDHHVILDQATVDPSGSRTHTIHLGAFLLDAGRTQEGTRHVELWNANGSPTKLDDLRIVATAYRAAEKQEPGI